MNPPDDRIALVGVGCRFPGASGPAEFWSNLRNGVESLRPISEAELVAAGVAPKWRQHPDYVAAGMTLSDIESFDADFFGLTAREAEMMDPQQRLLLECGWEALEDAGYPARSTGTRISAYLGARLSEYMLFNQAAPDLFGSSRELPLAGFQRLLVNDKDYLATRLAYLLDLRGPAITVQTACSTSLVALHLACQSLLNGECDMALAGGASVRVPQNAGYVFTEGMVFSRDGRTRPFDASAGGTVFGSGAGLVALKRYQDAVADRDNIYAVVLGTAVNNDGAVQKAGFTAPAQDGQVAIIAEALAVSGVDPATVSYVEAHGTGTALGDPIEIAALTEAFRAYTSANGFCAVGSVKGNLGHLLQAAGIAGLIKTALMLRHRELVPSLNFDAPNPGIDFANSPFFVNTELRPWGTGASVRRAGVSAFGFGGTNAHVVLEEPPATEAPLPAEPTYRVLPISARSGSALQELARRWSEHLADGPTALPDMCYTAQVGRSHFDTRFAAVGISADELREQFASLGTGPAPTEKSPGDPRVAFLFTGQGAQYAGMGHGLYESLPTFRDKLDECARILRPHVDCPLTDILFGTDAEQRLARTIYAQPALLALQIALVSQWLSWGIRPRLVLGHSLGELGAAWTAGVMTLDYALEFAALRGRLMESVTAGRMATVLASPDVVRAAIADYSDLVSIAAVNGPGQTVISGDSEAIGSILDELHGQGVSSRDMSGETPFHSPLIEAVLPQLEDSLVGARLTHPNCDFISTVSGRAASGELTEPGYWIRQSRDGVLFDAALNTMAQEGCDAMVEIGPNPILTSLGKAGRPELGGEWLPSLRRKRDDLSQMLEALVTMYAAGAAVDWAAVAADTAQQGRRASIPTYPFQRKRYWIEPTPPESAGSSGGPMLHPLVGRRIPSPLGSIQFQNELSADSTPFLRDHWVYDERPQLMVSYLEMVRAAVSLVSEGAVGIPTIENSVVQQPLLHTEHRRLVQTVLVPTDGDGFDFSLHSAPAEDPTNWMLHATGSARLETAGRHPETADLEALKERCPKRLNPEDNVVSKREKGAALGPAFHIISEAWTGPGEVLARATITDECKAGHHEYGAHPNILDCSASCAEYTIPEVERASLTDLFLPTVLTRASFYHPLPPEAWIHLKARPDASGDVRGIDARFMDDTGRVLAELEGFFFKRATPESLRRQAMAGGVASLLYEIQWEATNAQSNGVRFSWNGLWLILGDRGGVGQRLAGRIEEAGGTCLLVETPGGSSNGPRPPVDPSDPDAFDAVMRRVNELAGPTQPYRGAIHLWSLDVAADQEPEAAALLSCGSALHLAQAKLRAEPGNMDIWFVTRGAQATGRETGPLAPLQSPIWGFGRVIQREQPDLNCRLIDLDPARIDDEGVALFEWLARDERETQAARRNETWLGARLHRLGDFAPTGISLTVPDSAYVVEPGDERTLDGITMRRLERTQPGPDQVEIEVYVTGLGFRDVFNATGRVEGPIGHECSGVIAACGDAVKELSVGDEVMAIAYDSLSSHVTVDARWVVRKPGNLSFAAAATLPQAYLTALYGLEQRARVRDGDRVLINAAAGGVGLAAIQVARGAGGEVFATASRKKWKYLEALGIERPMDSRVPGFAREILSDDDQGIDVVLNTLGNDFVADNLAVLRPGSRLVELGHPDVMDLEALAAGADGVDAELINFYLGQDVGRNEPELIQSMFRDLVSRLELGQLRPLPYRCWPLRAVIEPLEEMLRGSHVGKLAILHPVADQGREVELVPDGTYLITGGLGSLGVSVARWLVSCGARHLVILSRRPAPDGVPEEFRELVDQGAELRFLSADISQYESAAEAFAEMAASLPPLRGVVHAAGVLDDGALQQQTWERFAEVMKPKVSGSWNLHVLTETMPLDFFVLFSSAASLLGNPGQSSYAAANTFQDQLAQFRRTRGLPAVSIDYSVWSGDGMGAGISEAARRNRSKLGLTSLSPEDGLQALAKAITGDDSHFGVIGVQWEKFVSQFAAGTTPLFYANVVTASPQPKPDMTAGTPKALPGTLDEIEGVIRRHIGALIGQPAEAVDVENSLPELGLDSLMALDLRGKFVTEFGPAGNLPVVRFLEGNSVSQLAAQVHDLVQGSSEEEGDDPAAAHERSIIRI